MKKETDIAVYQVDEKTNLSVRLDADTVWMTQKQIAILFGCDRTNITHHLKRIFKDGELEEKSVCENFSHTAADGKTYNAAYYNLDAVISVGFRVNSKRGIAFRQWANKVIRDRMKNELAQTAARAAEKAAKQFPAHSAKPRRLAPAPALSRAKSAATCIKCLFSRLVANAEAGTICECHVARPTANGFPLVRPDDFCPLHVAVRSRKRAFAGLVPEPPASATV